MEDSERQRLWSLPLEEKLAQAEEVIVEAFDRFGMEIAATWTGGKDSTTLIWLIRRVCRRLDRPFPISLFIDEGDIFPEIQALVEKVSQKWGIPVEVVRNDNVLRLVKDIGDPVKVAELNDLNRRELDLLEFAEPEFPFEPESYVGNHLMKTVPVKLFIEQKGLTALFTAIRWDEHDARESEDFFSPREDPSHVRVQPILHFRERDIWDVIHTYKLPFCELYAQGYRSLGARYNTRPVDDIPAWEQDFDNIPERLGRGQNKEQIMEQLRNLGYM